MAKNEYRCDNIKCKFSFNNQCIQSGYRMYGVKTCPDFTRQHMDPDEIYQEIVNEEEKGS